MRHTAVVMLVALLVSTGVHGAPINPLDDVHSMSPVDTILFPTGYGDGTGAGGNILSNTWYASTAKAGAGFLLEMQGMDFVRAVSVGKPLSGVDVLPDGRVVVSSGDRLYISTIVNGAWDFASETELVLGKQVIDVCYGYGMADYFVATTEGIWAVSNGELREELTDNRSVLHPVGSTVAQ